MKGIAGVLWTAPRLLILVIAVSIGSSAGATQRFDQASWLRNFHSILSDCIKATNNPDCLKEAYNAHLPPQEMPADAVFRAINGHPISGDLLRKRLCIYPNCDGTGYSKPACAGGSTFIRQPEYLVKNICVDEADEDGNTPHVWRFSADRYRELRDVPVKAILTDFSPAWGRGHIIDLVSERRDQQSQRLLVRFLALREGAFGGTLGRPDATHVFSCCLEDAKDKLLETAMKHTGSLQLLADLQSPSMDLLITAHVVDPPAMTLARSSWILELLRSPIKI